MRADGLLVLTRCARRLGQLGKQIRVELVFHTKGITVQRPRDKEKHSHRPEHLHQVRKLGRT